MSSETRGIIIVYTFETEVENPLTSVSVVVWRDQRVKRVSWVSIVSPVIISRIICGCSVPGQRGVSVVSDCRRSLVHAFRPKL